MSTAYAGVAQNHTTIPLPANADVPSGALFADPDGKNLDMIRQLQAGALGAGAGDKDTFANVHHLSLSTEFTYGAAGLIQGAAGGNTILSLSLPRQGTLKAVRVYVWPNVAARGGLPTKPTITVREVDLTVPGLAFTTIGVTTSDPSASVAVYETAHAIPITGLAYAIRADRVYRVTLTGETAGAFFSAGMSVLGVGFTVGP